MSCSSRTISYLLLVAFVGILIYSLFLYKSTNIPIIPVSQVVQEVKDKQINKIEVSGQNLTIHLKNNQTQKSVIESQTSLTEILNQSNIDLKSVEIDVANTTSSSNWIAILSVVLPVILIAGFIYFMLRSAQAGNSKALSFGQSRARLLGAGQTKVKFSDVAGLQEPKQELFEVVEFLKNPQKFQKLGAEIPKGFLLIGPPGTGKTMLAKAVAGEAGVPFFSLSASEFVEMFVGVGAARVRDLFEKAKRNAPAIIFIDELDAIGRLRGSGLGGSHDEREQTLNQILVEMDGFDTKTNVIIMAATNRPDVLDPALLRPGRFDRRVVLDLPDMKERLAILEIYGKNKPLDKDINFEKIARSTAGFSGADLKNLENEAAILAARNNKKEISMHELEEAIEKVMLGPERKSRVLNKKEKEITAYHEAGHAVVAKFSPNCDPVHKVSVISRGMALGYTWNLPIEDVHLNSKAKFEDDIASLLGGRVAEEIQFKDVTTGAENDLRRATKMARAMVTDYGMSKKLGASTFGEKEELTFLGKEIAEHKTYSEKIAAQIDEEVSLIIKVAENEARDILIKHKTVWDKLAKILIEKETVDEEDLDKLFPKISKG
jgi:cell division protease FtsH